MPIGSNESGIALCRGICVKPHSALRDSRNASVEPNQGWINVPLYTDSRSSCDSQPKIRESADSSSISLRAPRMLQVANRRLLPLSLHVFSVKSQTQPHFLSGVRCACFAYSRPCYQICNAAHNCLQSGKHATPTQQRQMPSDTISKPVFLRNTAKNVIFITL